jgi:drug/metabolite transporter (DMT)-like permease
MTIFAVVILSPDSVLIRLVEDASPDVDSWTVLFWRGALYAVGVSTLVFLKYRSKTISEFKNIGKGGLLIGFFSGISTGTFVFAIVYTSIANALVIISTGPIMIAIQVTRHDFSLSKTPATIAIMMGPVLIITRAFAIDV